MPDNTRRINALLGSHNPFLAMIIVLCPHLQRETRTSVCKKAHKYHHQELMQSLVGVVISKGRHAVMQDCQIYQMSSRRPIYGLPRPAQSPPTAPVWFVQGSFLCLET